MDKQKLNTIIGANIRARREAKGIVRREVWDVMEPSQLGQLELGKRSAPLHVFYKIAKMLDCEVADLLPSMKEVGL